MPFTVGIILLCGSSRGIMYGIITCTLSTKNVLSKYLGLSCFKKPQSVWSSYQYLCLCAHAQVPVYKYLLCVQHLTLLVLCDFNLVFLHCFYVLWHVLCNV